MAFGQQLNIHRIIMRLAKALIRLRVCAGWSEPLPVAHTTLLEISCHGSIITFPAVFIRTSSRYGRVNVLMWTLEDQC